MSQGYTVTVNEENCDVTVIAPGAAGALGYYGAFFSDQDQAAAAVNTPTAMTLNNTAEANGISIVSNSRITFAYPGTYDIQFSAQAHHRGGGGNGLELDIWFRKNGTNLADSATKLIIQKNDYLVPAWDYLLTVNAGDYVELMYQVTNTDIVLEHAVADGVPVDTPSLIVNVMQVMYTQVGPQGPAGLTGATGGTGPAGAAATITAGTTTTLSPGASATVTNAGTSSAAIFNFGIPAGVKGDKGDTGDAGATGAAATIAAGTTTTLSPGSSATVTNSGTSSTAVFDFGIPQGLTGATGGTGPAGPGVAVGGSTGQVLAKTSATDYATEWVTPTPVGAQYVTLATDSTLTNERVLAAGTGITVTDGGAGSNVTVATTAILPTIIDAKGDLLVGTTADTVARLAVGSTANQVLVVDSSTASGLKWGDPSLSGAGARALNSTGAYLDGSTGMVSGTVNEFATTPDSAALSITGDIDIRWFGAWTNWSAPGQMVSKWGVNTQHSFLLIGDGQRLRFYWSTNGTTDNNFRETTTDHNIPNGTAKWVRVTLDVDNGSTQHEVKFFLSDDGTNWTQLGSTVTTAGTTSIWDGNRPLELKGNLVKRAQVLNGIDGTVQFDANFATQTANLLAFTESSTNAATVTITTTRYTYGLPNIQWNTSNITQALTINRVHYQPFLVSAPIIVDGTQFHVSTGPASSANVRTGIYRADGNMQPTGAPIIDAGNTVVGTSATGTFFTQVTPVTLQPGIYLTAINTSVALTVRVQRGGIVGTDIANGTSSIISLMYASQTQGALPNPGTVWDTRTFSNTSPNHYLFLRWSPA
jgi:hypothetical protein